MDRFKGFWMPWEVKSHQLPRVPSYFDTRNLTLYINRSILSEGNILRNFIYTVRAGEIQNKLIYKQLGSTDFNDTMVKLGCLQLEIMLFHLGGHQPSYLSSTNWGLKDLFNIKNQIPLGVLEELMVQSFFIEVLKSGEWKQPKDLTRMMLFEVFVVPLHKRVKEIEWKSSPMGNLMQDLSRRVQDAFRQCPDTLIDALWFIFIGRGKRSPKVNLNNNLLADEAGYGAHFGSRPWPMIPSATELHKKGVKFSCIEGLGSRGIKFNTCRFGPFGANAILYLPILWIDDMALPLFENLIEYEKEVFTDASDMEFCSYLQLMRDLIRTPEDVDLLTSSYIILATPEQHHKLPQALRRLEFPAGNMCNIVRREIHDYVKPSKWKRMTNLLSCALILGIIQTVYVVLTFHLRR